MQHREIVTPPTMTISAPMSSATGGDEMEQGCGDSHGHPGDRVAAEAEAERGGQQPEILRGQLQRDTGNLLPATPNQATASRERRPDRGD